LSGFSPFWIRIRNVDPDPGAHWMRIQCGSGFGSETLRCGTVSGNCRYRYRISENVGVANRYSKNLFWFCN
jgi:hypothetical protein